MRIVGVSEGEPLDYIKLFPALQYKLRRLHVTLDRSNRFILGKDQEKRKKLERAMKARDAQKILRSVADELHSDPRIKSGPPFMGREEELRLLSGVLEGKRRLSCLLVGDPLVGKTSLFLAWLRLRIETGSAPMVYSTSAARLIAGMSGLGQWQERIRRVMDAAKTLDAIIYFEQFEDLFSERTGSKVDISGFMKSWLEEHTVRIIGELKPEQVDIMERSQVAFFSYLTKIRVPSLSAKATLDILKRTVNWTKTYRPKIPLLKEDAIEPLVDLADRYLPYRAFPGKAVRFLEELQMTKGTEQTTGDGPLPITRRMVFDAFGLQSGIPAFLLQEEFPLKSEEVESALHKNLIGQDMAVRKVAESICRVKAGIQPPDKPLTSFLFVGPTGVGKTELARSLSSLLFGSRYGLFPTLSSTGLSSLRRDDERLIRFDMSEFMHIGAAEQLIGGSEKSDGLLTRRVREQPFCVILFDEIEKAHPSVFDLLLQVLGEARLTDVHGKTAFFHNAIIVMTSNIGTREPPRSLGFGAVSNREDSRYLSAVHDHFRPEFVNRIDGIIPFSPLSRDEIMGVTKIIINSLQARRCFTEFSLSLKVTDRTVEQFGIGGYSEEFGARALRRHIEECLITPVARLVSAVGLRANNGSVTVSMVKELKGPAAREVEAWGSHRSREPLVTGTSAKICYKKFLFELSYSKSSESRYQLQGVSAITGHRRVMERYFRLDRMEDIRSHMDYLSTQMSSYSKSSKDQRVSTEQSKLSREYERLGRWWKRAEKLRSEMCDLEDLSLLALFSGENLDTFMQDGISIQKKFEQNLFKLLVSYPNRYHSVTLMIQELDRGAFDLWLVELLSVLRKNKWSAQVHIDGDTTPVEHEWPVDLRWGPPLPPKLAIEKILGERSFSNVVLTCEGPNAGAILAFEKGLINLVKNSNTELKLYVRLIAMRSTLTSTEWQHPELTPNRSSQFYHMEKEKPARLFDFENQLVKCGKDLVFKIPFFEYWDRVGEVCLKQILDRDQLKGKEMEDFFTAPFPVIPPPEPPK